MTTEMRGQRRAKLQGDLMFPAAAFERLAVELLRIVQMNCLRQAFDRPALTATQLRSFLWENSMTDCKRHRGGRGSVQRQVEPCDRTGGNVDDQGQPRPSYRSSFHFVYENNVYQRVLYLH